MLHRYSYKLKSLQKLQSGDTAMSESFAEWAMKIIQSDLKWLFDVFWINKAQFTSQEDVFKVLLYERRLILVNTRRIRYIQPNW